MTYKYIYIYIYIYNAVTQSQFHCTRSTTTSNGKSQAPASLRTDSMTYSLSTKAMPKQRWPSWPPSVPGSYDCSGRHANIHTHTHTHAHASYAL